MSITECDVDDQAEADGPWTHLSALGRGMQWHT